MPLKANARCLGYCYYLPTGKSYAASNCIPIQQTWIAVKTINLFPYFEKEN